MALEILPMLEAEAKERQSLAGGDMKSEEYKKSVVSALIQPIIITPPPNGHSRSVQAAAAITGASSTNVSMLKRISKAAEIKQLQAQG